MSLRDRCIEAGVRAIWDEWDSLDDFEALDPDGKANALADVEIVLDAVLDCLAENKPPHLSMTVDEIVALLREGDTGG